MKIAVIVIFLSSSLYATGAPTSRCVQMLGRARESGSTRAVFVPTHHWIPADTSTGQGISKYCYMQGYTGSNECMDWTDALIAEFKQGMTLCFKEALQTGVTIYIRPQLDDGTNKGAWRNGLLFRPAEKYGGYSYYDIMLAPLADALHAAFVAVQPMQPELQRVYFGMQGEMSACIMRYPQDWSQMANVVRQRVIGGDVVGVQPRIKADIRMGVGLNFNRLDDTTSVSQTYDSSRLSWLMWVTGAQGTSRGAPPIDKPGVQALMNHDIDFVGLSAYAPLSGPGFALNELENSAFMFGDSMKEFGVDVLSLLNSGKLELHYSEFGLGGGGNYAGNQPATTPAAVALRPFYGVYAAYSTSRDPWQTPANRALLQEFWSKTAAWLANPFNKTYKISGLFVWSKASWDVLGIYPESTTPEGTYRDMTVLDTVQQHNWAILWARNDQNMTTTTSGAAVAAAAPQAARVIEIVSAGGGIGMNGADPIRVMVVDAAAGK